MTLATLKPIICNASDPTGFHISQKVGENMKLNSILFLSRVIEKKKKERKKKKEQNDQVDWVRHLIDAS